jgi:L-rhamnose mutarotase
MIRKAFVFQLKPGCREEYERRHNPIWPELAAVLREHGARNYSIFCHEESGKLFGYVEIEDEARWRAVAQTQVCRRWWGYMKDLMETNADNSPVAVELEKVFHLD